MRRLMITTVMLVLFCTGCSKTNTFLTSTLFVGNSPEWEGKILQKSMHRFIETPTGTTYNGLVSKQFILHYTGPNRSSVKALRYSWESGLGGGSGDTTLNRDGYALTGATHDNSAAIPEDAVIKVVVEWNGKQETFKLYPKQYK